MPRQLPKHLRPVAERPKFQAASRAAVLKKHPEVQDQLIEDENGQMRFPPCRECQEENDRYDKGSLTKAVCTICYAKRKEGLANGAPSKKRKLPKVGGRKVKEDEAADEEDWRKAMTDEDELSDSDEDVKHKSKKQKLVKTKPVRKRHPRLNPLDPDGDVPLPAFQPGTRQPFPLGSSVACSNYKKTVTTMDKYELDVDYIYPRPRVCSGEDCAVMLDPWTNAYVYSRVQNNSVYLQFQRDSCKDCLHKARDEWRDELTPETKADKWNAEVSQARAKLKAIALGLVERQIEHERKRRVAIEDTFVEQAGGKKEAINKTSAFILALRSSGGSMTGDKLIKFSSNEKAAKFQSAIDSFNETARCYDTGIRIRLNGPRNREHDQVSIDRLHSDLPYFHPEQELRLVSWGANMMQGDLTEAQREKLKLKLASPNVNLANASLIMQDLAVAPKTSKYAETRSAKQIRDFTASAKHLGYDPSTVAQNWGHRDDVRINAQRSRSTPGTIKTSRMVHREDGSVVWDRQAWCEGADAAEQHAVAKKFIIAAGGVCAVTGNEFEMWEEGKGGTASGWRLDYSTDRIIEDQPYSVSNCWVVLEAVNTLKSGLSYFRTSTAFDTFLKSQPRLRVMSTQMGWKFAAAEAIRVELEGGPGENGLY